jgi:hypothetical protein
MTRDMDAVIRNSSNGSSVSSIVTSGATSVGAGLLVGLVVWVGLVASVLLTQVTYEHLPFAFVAITAGYRLVTLQVMAAILSAWQ